MKFLFDLFPVILFFGMFKWSEGHPDAAQAFANEYLSNFVSGGVVTATQAPILLATAVTIIANIGQIVYLLIKGKKVDAPLWMSLIIVGLFGGATIYFHNEAFIKWKPSILYWCFAAALFISQTVFKKNLIRKMMEQQVSLPETAWQQLNWAWVLFFAAMGIVNLYVAFNFSTAAWVNFKLFGFMGLMLVFIIAQSVFLAKHIKTKP